MAVFQERYEPVVCAANATTDLPGAGIGGFLAWTSGTITVTDSLAVEIISDLPVTAGIYTPLPFELGSEGGSVTTAGGASGTMGN